MTRQAWLLGQGALPPASEWPGRMHDALLILAGERARRDEAQRKHAEKTAKDEKLRARG